MCESSEGLVMVRRFGVELEGYVDSNIYGCVNRPNGYEWDIDSDGSLRSSDDEERCDDCDGDGEVSCSNCDSDGEVPCSNCDRDGRIECCECNGDGNYIDEDTGEELICIDCGGDGYEVCDECNGSGYNDCDECDGTNLVRCTTCDGDGVTETSGSEYGIEAKSEPLLNSGPIYDIYEYLHEHDWAVDNTAGLHIHVEVADYEWHDFQKLVALVAGIEPLIYSVTGSYRYDTTGYCSSLEGYHTGVRRVLKLQESELRGISNLYFTERRYMGLNLQSYTLSRKTVEFRYFSPQNDADMVEAYADLVTRIVDFAKHATYEQVLVITKKLISIDNFNEAFDVVSEVLELKRAEKLRRQENNIYSQYDRFSLAELEEISARHSIAI